MREDPSGEVRKRFPDCGWSLLPAIPSSHRISGLFVPRANKSLRVVRENSKLNTGNKVSSFKVHNYYSYTSCCLSILILIGTSVIPSPTRYSLTAMEKKRRVPLGTNYHMLSRMYTQCGLTCPCTVRICSRTTLLWPYQYQCSLAV